MISNLQAKYFAFELTRRFPSGSTEKFNMALVDAQVDLNPHQVEAALFAFQSPLSKGSILADEVGLGKTIEAGIILSQLWAERKRKLIIICPANLRKQWSQELKEKFFLDSLILENKTYNQIRKDTGKNPFQIEKILICSYQFAKEKADVLEFFDWDLVVIDEAHRLRNVYKPGNKIGAALKSAFQKPRKILLTATPLQNSLLELYGLVSLIDDNIFGDLKSFRSQFLRTEEGENYQDLKERIRPICIRNLRRDVQEYIRYTSRIPLTIKFEPSEVEQTLYNEVSEYLREEILFALPPGQRHLMTMILRKLLASSTYAIAGTLISLAKKLELLVENQERQNFAEELALDFEQFEEAKEEWEEEEDPVEPISLEELEMVKKEIVRIKSYAEIAQSIKENSKGEKLMFALKEGFSKMHKEAPRKAIIFTESTRTQTYLLNLLQDHFPGKIVLFNGSNNDPISNRVYKSWVEKFKGTDRVSGSPTADKRAALVDFFRDEATIMIATEAAAEGVNLQFCSLLINYDLPWNPQRIEQRIGRCHRYGQKYDVVVVNFLNEKNAADVRVFNILDQKFKLFSGVFGASDEVLGSIESGVDFEKRIAEIYQKYRTEKEITQQFDLLQKELEEQINQKMIDTRDKLLTNFDTQVLDKLKIRLDQSRQYITRYEEMLWEITKFQLQKNAAFEANGYSFHLTSQPFSDEHFALGSYKLGRPNTKDHVYRLGHSLAQRLIETAKGLYISPAHYQFKMGSVLSNELNPWKGKSGWLTVLSITMESFEISDHLVLIAQDMDGNDLSNEAVQYLLRLPAIEEGKMLDFDVVIKEKKEKFTIERLLSQIAEGDQRYMQLEVEKLNKWAEDKMSAIELAIRETKSRIKELNRQSAKILEPLEMLANQEELINLGKQQKRQRHEIFEAEDEIAKRRDLMISEIKSRMKQQFRKTEVFTITWHLD